MSSQKHFHFIGIGGIGMSGIALALINKGYSVSGSDPKRNEQIYQLKNQGAIIFDTQKASNIDLITSKFIEKKISIVVSSAIKDQNEELQFCIKNKLSIKHRSEILSIIMQGYKSIGVAGSHGKTSTSALLSTLLSLSCKDTSLIIGGILPLYDSNAFIKKSKYLVAEIDESDGTTKNYKPYLGIINNIDFDHCDHYANLKELISSFSEFALNSEKLLTNFDCQITQSNISSDYTWSVLNKNNVDFSLIPKELNEEYTIADYYEKGNYISTFKIPIPGLHNLSNLAAAISACRIIDINIKYIIKNIQFLKLPKKRFEFKGEIAERKVFDDYGHHPNEIKATIELGRLFINNKNESSKRLVLIFQPHRYSRINKFIHKFVEELSKADLIIITDIYSAGENNPKNITSQIIVDKIYKINKNVQFISNNYKIFNKFFDITSKGDLIINMGAGNCHDLWSLLKSY